MSDDCAVRFGTQAPGGISDNRLICAAMTQTIFAPRCGGAVA